MGEVLPMPSFGDLFTDTRGDDRTMRISYHPERGAVVLSLWSGTVCRGSFRMAVDDVPALQSLLTEIQLSVDPAASTGPQAAGGFGAGTAAAVAAPAATGAAVDETGDISGTAHRVAPPIPLVPWVA